jgi:hypothetical protein
MINYKISELNLIGDYLDLYKSCFPGFDKNIEYFRWLYQNNPMGDYIGIDAFDGDKLIGQIGGIPFNFKFCDKNIKTLVSINICIDKSYRGGRIFYNLSSNFENLLINHDYDLLIAIGNKAATPAWIKSLNLRNFGQLKSYVGIPKFSNKEIILKNYKLFMNWQEETIKWRCSNPMKKTQLIKFKNKKLVYAKTKFPMIKAYTPFPFDLDFEPNNIKIDLTLKTFVGFCDEVNESFLFRKIPKILKPSPLNFLYKFLKKDYVLNESEVFFSFLDFDAF